MFVMCDLMERHPQIEVELKVSDRPVGNGYSPFGVLALDVPERLREDGGGRGGDAAAPRALRPLAAPIRCRRRNRWR